MAARTTAGIARRRAKCSSAILFSAVAALVGALVYMASRGDRVEASNPPQRAYVPEFQTLEVPVPERAIPAGTLVRNIPTRIERFAEHQLPAGAILDLKAHSEKASLAAIPGGLPILLENLGSPEEGSNPVVGRIPIGMRAMAVKVDATASVEGWARSGSVVDVLLIEKSRTIVVAEQVKVLSVERSVSPVEERLDAATPSTVTILVTQEQCLAINTAAPLGRIAFALRGVRDSSDWKSTSFTSSDLEQNPTTTTPIKIAGRATFIRDGKPRKFALVDGVWIVEESIAVDIENQSGE